MQPQNVVLLQLQIMTIDSNITHTNYHRGGWCVGWSWTGQNASTRYQKKFAVVVVAVAVSVPWSLGWFYLKVAATTTQVCDASVGARL